MVKGAEGYKPSRDYWKEIDKLDARITDLATPVDPKRVLLVLRLGQCVALWAGDAENTLCYWNKTGFGGVAAASALWISELGVVKPRAKGLPAKSGEPQIGMMGRELVYSSGFKMWHRLEENYGYFPNITQPDSMQKTKAPQAASDMEEQFGLTRPGEEAYETLLKELRRGASGDFRISYPAPAE
jgi:hypothetical protein